MHDTEIAECTGGPNQQPAPTESHFNNSTVTYPPLRRRAMLNRARTGGSIERIEAMADET